MSHSGSTPRQYSGNAKLVAVLYLLFAGLWIFASDRLLNLALDDPELLLKISMGKGFAFVLITTLLLYLLLRNWEAAASAPPLPLPAAPHLRNLLALFVGLVLIVPLIAFSIVRLHGPQMRETAFNDLRAIANLKVGQIQSWLQERHNDAEMLSGSEGFTDHAELLVKRNDPRARSYVEKRLKLLIKTWGFDSALLLDRDGKVVLSVGEHGAIPQQVKQALLPAALAENQVQRSELYRDEQGRIHLDFIAPLNGGDLARQPVAAVVLHAPVEPFLFRHIQSWPTPSPSAESLLVRRDGDNALFLNELRHRKGAVLTFRIPLTDPTTPAVAAILDNQPHVMEGVDYRGVAVFSAYQPVPGTPWRLVAKIDRDEVLAPLANLTFWVSLLAFAAISAVSAAILLLWRQALRAHSLELQIQASVIQQQSEAKYRRLHESMRDAFAMVDMNGRLIDFNRAYQELLGYSDAELRQLTYLDLTPAEWRDEEMRIIREQVIPLGQSQVFEKEYQRKDGSVFPVELKAFLICSEDGLPEAMWAIVRDITERKRDEQALLESERRFRQLFQSMLNGFALHEIICDGDGKPVDYRFLEVNPAFENLTGLKAENLIGKTVLEVLPNNEPLWVERYGKVALSGEAAHFEEFSREIGKYFEVTVYSPQPGRFAVIFSDVTERKSAEAAIRQLNADLEKKVDQRTAQLKSAVSELETFAYSVSHDLKAPLRGIDGYSRLLQEDHASRLNEEGRTFIANIRTGAQQMNQLIEDLLAYSRLERRTLQNVRISPAQVAKAIAGEFAGELESRAVELHLDIPPDLEVRADVESLATILRNLLDNAIKFSRNTPHPLIEAGVREDAESAVLWVRDNGIGFDMRFHDRIFDIFQRLQRAEEYPGTGIGLAIVRKAAQRMGGRAWAESAPGRGATFFVELPK